jgi:hypothetical protein
MSDPLDFLKNNSSSSRVIGSVDSAWVRNTFRRQRQSIIGFGNPIIISCTVTALLSLLLGYFIGREHVKYEIRSALEEAFQRANMSFGHVSQDIKSDIFDGNLGKQVRNNMHDIELQVAADAEEQYKIAKRSGHVMDAYIHAGLVAAAYLQAKDEANYQKWKEIEKAEAARANLTGF